MGRVDNFYVVVGRKMSQSGYLFYIGSGWKEILQRYFIATIVPAHKGEV